MASQNENSIETIISAVDVNALSVNVANYGGVIDIYGVGGTVPVHPLYTPLDSNGGFTEFRIVDAGTIELVAMACDIQLTREEIAELARRFPVASADKVGSE